MDGLTVSRLMQLDAERAGIPRLLLNSTNTPPPKQTLRAAGPAATLLKPVRPSRLLDCLIQLHDPGDRMGYAVIPGSAAPSSFSFSSPSHTAARAEGGATPPPRLRLLLAEENPINRRVILLQLRQLGYKADMARNGCEVLAAVEWAPYDIILMDCQMPELDGYGTTRRLRDRFPAPDFISSPSPPTPWPATGAAATRRAWTTTSPNPCASAGWAPRSCGGGAERHETPVFRSPEPGILPRPSSALHGNAVQAKLLLTVSSSFGAVSVS